MTQINADGPVAASEKIGVSIDVFAGCVRVLDKVHGPRVAGPEAFNRILVLLTELENLYIAAPVKSN